MQQVKRSKIQKTIENHKKLHQQFTVKQIMDEGNSLMLGGVNVADYFETNFLYFTTLWIYLSTTYIHFTILKTYFTNF
jgi:hypothetical protein